MKRKGFTLVELLAVIVILAVIALIAVPMIVGVIEKSRRGSLQNSGYGLVEAGNLYNAQYQNASTVRFDIKDNEITTNEENKLVYKGNVKEGTVLINNKGEVTVCINDGKYAAYKNFSDNKVTIVDNKTCTIPENSNIVYLDNEATIDINITELLSRIESLENEVNTLKEEKSNNIDVTNAMNNLTNTHQTDFNLLNGMINTNGNSINAIKNILNGPVVTSTATANLPGVVQHNTLYKNGFAATIRFYIEVSEENNMYFTIATLPEDFRPPFDCYVMGLAYNGSWVSMSYIIFKDGTIRQNFGNGSYSKFIIQATYPIQTNM